VKSVEVHMQKRSHSLDIGFGLGIAEHLAIVEDDGLRINAHTTNVARAFLPVLVVLNKTWLHRDSNRMPFLAHLSKTDCHRDALAMVRVVETLEGLARVAP
jgi:hypothetical protein